ncbi:transcriptional regulator [Thioalkalivibrio sp.]|uniref:winged helix-turn-helix domain-containing protein n=1 Tax=Thioalkalivibrio sp. TaxID=2093813 RepID=UPI0039770DD8
MLKSTMAPVQIETGSFVLPGVFWVGDYRIHPGENQVRSEAGSIQVESKVMSLLVYLARNAGSTITREQLFEAVWPGVVVTDDTLTQAVAKLRKAFADDARNPWYIQTVPKGGYRLCAAVRFGSDAPAVSRAGAAYRWRYFFRDPGGHRHPGRLSEFKPNRFTGLLLDHTCAGQDFTAAGHIVHPQLHHVAAPEFAVDREVEQREFLDHAGHFQPGPQGPRSLCA